MTGTRSKSNPFQELSDFFSRPEKWVPPMDLYTKEGTWMIQVELPGVDPKDIHISVMGDELSIQGERKGPEGFKEDDFLLQESPYGPFERTIILPHAVPDDKVEAIYSSGVLTIKLPAVSERAKEIPIQAEDQQKIEAPKKEEAQKKEPTESKKEMPKAA